MCTKPTSDSIVLLHRYKPSTWTMQVSSLVVKSLTVASSTNAFTFAWILRILVQIGSKCATSPLSSSLLIFWEWGAAMVCAESSTSEIVSDIMGPGTSTRDIIGFVYHAYTSLRSIATSVSGSLLVVRNSNRYRADMHHGLITVPNTTMRSRSILSLGFFSCGIFDRKRPDRPYTLNILAVQKARRPLLVSTKTSTRACRFYCSFPSSFWTRNLAGCGGSFPSARLGFGWHCKTETKGRKSL